MRVCKMESIWLTMLPAGAAGRSSLAMVLGLGIVGVGGGCGAGGVEMTGVGVEGGGVAMEAGGGVGTGAAMGFPSSHGRIKFSISIRRLR